MHADAGGHRHRHQREQRRGRLPANHEGQHEADDRQQQAEARPAAGESTQRRGEPRTQPLVDAERGEHPGHARYGAEEEQERPVHARAHHGGVQRPSRRQDRDRPHPEPGTVDAMQALGDEACDQARQHQQAEPLVATHRPEDGALQGQAVGELGHAGAGPVDRDDRGQRHAEQHQVQRQGRDEPVDEAEPLAHLGRQQAMHQHADRGAREEQTGHLPEPQQAGEREPGGRATAHRIAQCLGDLAHHRGGQCRTTGGVGKGRGHRGAHQCQREAAAREPRGAPAQRRERDPVEQAGVAHGHADGQHGEHQHPCRAGEAIERHPRGHHATHHPRTEQPQRHHLVGQRLGGEQQRGAHHGQQRVPARRPESFGWHGAPGKQRRQTDGDAQQPAAQADVVRRPRACPGAGTVPRERRRLSHRACLHRLGRAAQAGDHALHFVLRTGASPGLDRIDREASLLERAGGLAQAGGQQAAPPGLVDEAQQRGPDRRRHDPVALVARQQRRDPREGGQSIVLALHRFALVGQQHRRRGTPDQGRDLDAGSPVLVERGQPGANPAVELGLEVAQRAACLGELGADRGAEVQHEFRLAAQQRKEASPGQHPDTHRGERDHARRAPLLGEQRELPETLERQDGAHRAARHAALGDALAKDVEAVALASGLEQGIARVVPALLEHARELGEIDCVERGEHRHRGERSRSPGCVLHLAHRAPPRAGCAGARRLKAPPRRAPSTAGRSRRDRSR